MAPPDPFDTDFDRFTDAELQSWFDDNVAGTDQFESTLDAINDIGPLSGEVETRIDDELHQGGKTLLDNQGIISGSSDLGPRDMIKRVDWSAAFARLGRESQLKLLRGWARQYPGPEKLVFPKDPADIDVDFGPDTDSDPEWQLSYGAGPTITLPDGTKMVDSAGSNPDYIPTDYVLPPDSDPAPSPSSTAFNFSKWKVWIGIGGVLGSILVLGLVFITGGDGEIRSDTNGDISGEVDDTSADQAQANTASTVAADPCAAVREQELILELTSPDVQPVIPIEFGSGGNGFLAPAFDWSLVPEETTEIAILVLRLDDERAALYAEDPLLWWGGPSIDEAGSGGVPVGAATWLVTGIDPSATGLAQSSQRIPLPEGAIEQSTPGGGYAQYEDIEGDFMYRGTGMPGVKHLFTVFALCNPTTDFVDDPGLGWLKRFSIATGWFISESA